MVEQLDSCVDANERSDVPGGQISRSPRVERLVIHYTRVIEIGSAWHEEGTETLVFRYRRNYLQRVE